MTAERSVQEFLHTLASAAPTPGGGAAAALMGSMGAALAAMVAHLTLGKKGYEEVDAEMRELLQQADALRERCYAMMAADEEAFDAVMAAYRLPKEDEAATAERGRAIQQALQRATEVPLDGMEAGVEVMRLCRRIAATGNRNVISDAGVGVLAGYAALRSAALNVYINLGALKDREFAAAAEARLQAALAGSDELLEEVYAKVRERL